MTEQSQPPKEAAFFTTIRQWGLTRGEHGVVGGVVEGLGARVGMAAVPARLIVVLAWFLLSGLVMLGYAAAWGLLPDRRGNIIIQNFGRGVTNVGALLGIAVLTLFGFGRLSEGPAFNVFGWGVDPFPWDNLFSSNGTPGILRLLAVLFALFAALLFVAGVVVLIVWLVRRSKDSNPPSSPGAGGWAAMPGEPRTPDAGAGAAAPVPPSAPAASSAADASTQTGTPGAGSGTSAPQTEQARASAADTTAVYPTAASTRGEDATAEYPTAVHPTAVYPTAEYPAGVAPTASHTPQPWEPALLPGDPRVAGVAASAMPGQREAQAPPSPPVPPAPYAPARSPRPQIPGPGKGGYFAFLGVLFIAAAIVFNIERMDRLAVNPVLAWGAIVTVGLGVVLIAVALTGRKLGFLGFLSVLAVLAGVPLAADAEDIRSDFDDPWNWWSAEISIGADYVTTSETPDEAVPVEPAADLTAPFTSDYAQVFVGSGCWALSDSADPQGAADPQQWSGAGQSSIRIDDVGEGTTVEVGDGATTLTIPAGTSVTLGQGDYAHLVWEERNLECDFWGEDITSQGDWLSATNPGDPVLEIQPVGTDAAIFIQEEQS